MKTIRIISSLEYRYLVIVLLIAFTPCFSGLAGADNGRKAVPVSPSSVYVIGDISGSGGNFPLVHYLTSDTELIEFNNFQLVNHELGAVSLALDYAREKLFVTYESYDSVEVFNALDGNGIGVIQILDTYDLAGMVVHQSRGHLYVVDRGDTDVYVYDTDTLDEVETWELPTGYGGWGIDLLGNNLYVADSTETVRYYDIDSHDEVGTITTTEPAIGIAVTDYPEHLIFTTAFNGGSGLSDYLTKYAVGSGIEETIYIGNEVKGVALNPPNDIAYVVADHSLHIVDFETLTLEDTIPFNASWVPTDVLSTHVSFTVKVTKTSDSHPGGKIQMGDQVTFIIEVENQHFRPISSISLKDRYRQKNIQFVSADPEPDDPTDDGELIWSNLIDDLGFDLTTGETIEVELTFMATEDCGNDLELPGINTAEIYDIVDDQDDPVEGESSQFDYIINCRCRADSDCDDSEFCTGIETCNEDGSCTSPGNPCPVDDGLYCNGKETAECDEENDECGHENEPCLDDGLWCNGTISCNEENDECEDTGVECVNGDGLYCNGTETCDEEQDTCLHSGNPCTENQICEESSQKCLGGEDDGDDSDRDEDEEVACCCG